VIDVEQRLRELGEQVDPAAATPALPSPRTLRRIQVRQRMVSLASVGAVAIIVGSLLVWGPSLHLSIGDPSGGGVGNVNTGPSGRGPGPSTPPGWVTHHSKGVSIATPKHWIFQRQNPANLLRPTIDFSLGTWRFSSGGSCAPTKALKAVPPKGMFLYMFEYPAAGRRGPFPPRSARFKLGPTKGPFECLGVKAHVILFRFDHRFFQIYIKLGPQARRSLRREVVESLNTMKIARR
jgi:hypothetical protein